MIKWWKMPAACKIIIIDRHDYNYDGDDHDDNYDHNDDVVCGQCDQLVGCAFSLIKNMIMIRTKLIMIAFSWKDSFRTLDGQQFYWK